MKNFNAQQAKQIVDSLHTDELHNILVDIKSKAEKGEISLHIHTNISDTTKQLLIEKGFTVVNESSIAIQKHGVYVSIYWA